MLINNLKIGDKIKFKRYYNPFDFDVEVGTLNVIEKNYFLVSGFVGDSIATRIPKVDVVSKLIQSPLKYKEIKIKYG